MPAGKVLSQGAMKLCIDSLKHYPLDIILAALTRHVQTARFAPAPADIINLLEAHNNRLSADEAWATRPKSEEDTVVWTQEAAEAYAIAYEIICEGDKIAARMAFKGAYERLCSESALLQRPVKWSVSIGYDKAKIESVLMQAMAAGRLTQDRVNKYLPAPTDAGLIAGLISGKVTDLPTNDENLKRRWGELGTALKAGQMRLREKEKQRGIDAENKRSEFEQLRQAQLSKVSEKMRATC